MRRLTLPQLHDVLLDRFGPQHWWPGDTPVEIMAGAILTQNTNWKNVEKAVANLKWARLLSIPALATCDSRRLARLIRPAGYYNVKAKRLKSYFRWFLDEIGADETGWRSFPAGVLRKRMLDEVSGVGPETVDSILLYALDRPVFVIDAYTRRILSRHGRPQLAALKYDDIQSVFHNALPRNTARFNEFHALFVACGKLCRKNRPLCSACPLSDAKIVVKSRERRRICTK